MTKQQQFCRVALSAPYLQEIPSRQRQGCPWVSCVPPAALLTLALASLSDR